MREHQLQKPVEPGYIPALRFRPLTHWYDFIIRATIRESTFKSSLVEQTCIEGQQEVLDLGCGTGTLTLLLKSRYPQAEITGIDADPQILEMARTKAAASNAAVYFAQAMAYALPFPDHSFDRVVSSLVFHHLTAADKLRTLQEVHRVLRPAGQLHIADFGRPQNPLMRAAFFFVQIFDGFASTSSSVAGALPTLISDAGFPAPTETAVFATMFGTIRLLKIQKP
jgi:ubiquinone/menaquinone biosynthesis C-methylase UbiE